MRTRCTLSHATLGNRVIDGPDGINDLVMNLKRHDDFHSLYENFDGEFWFFGDDGNIDGGLDFILEAEALDGPDVTIDLTFEIAPNDYVFFTAFAGQLLLAGITKTDSRALIPVVRNDFSAKFKNRLDQPVNIQAPLDQDGNAADVLGNVELSMLSQTVPMAFDGISASTGGEDVTDAPSLADFNAFNFFQMSWDKIELEEFDEYYLLPQAGNTEEPAENFNLVYAGEYRVVCQTMAYMPNSGPDGGVVPFVAPYLNIDGVEYPFIQRIQPYPVGPTTYTNSEYCEWTIDQTFNLLVGSRIKVYFKLLNPIGFFTNFRWNGPFEDAALLFPYRYTFQSTLEVFGQTTYPSTEADGFLVHDVAGMILDRTIGRANTFYSELLGSDRTLYRQYEADGCQWEYMLLRGLQIRQYDIGQKPFFIDFKKWWEGVNPIFCLGLGYETIDGVEVMRCESREHFYQREPSVYINNVTFKRRYDERVMIKTFRNGYKKWQSENISGLDDSQTKQTRASRLQKSGTDLTQESEFIAASIAIESTRRVTIKKSADYKFDEDIFIIAVNPVETSPAAQYEPKLDEGFESITGLSNASTRYNSILTPARNFLRWAKWLYGGLQNYVGSVFKFTGGEGNYDMTSDYVVSDGCQEINNVSESQDFTVTEDFIHRGEVFDVEFPYEIEDWLTIVANKKNAVAMSQTSSGHKIFLINNLDYKWKESKVTGEVWGVEFFDPEVVEESGLDQVCYPHEADACLDALLTELGLELTTEDNECLVLE